MNAKQAIASYCFGAGAVTGVALFLAGAAFGTAAGGFIAAAGPCALRNAITASAPAD